MRRSASRFVIVVLGLGLGLVGAVPAGAQSERSCKNEQGCVLVIGITGFVDSIVADYITTAVRSTSPSDGYRAIVLTVDSTGLAITDDEFAQLMESIGRSAVPVSAWVGPSGAEARGGAAELVLALEGSSMASGTEIGELGATRLADSEVGTVAAAASIRTEMVSEKRAVKLGLVEASAPLLGDHVLNIEGMPSRVVKDDKGDPKRELLATGVVQKLPLTSQLFHTAASPSVAYLFLSIAIGLLLFEFFTAGVGVAGLVGALAAVMAGFGLGELPTRPWALGLCLFAAFAFAIDIQTAIPRLWTWIGLLCWGIGSIFLLDGIGIPIVALVSGIGGIAATMLSGMPAMVRSRFATPTLGRGWLIGLEGVATSGINPDGLVEVEGAPWRALTNRATPIQQGEGIRVVAIDGLTLEVEPLEGGAMDYREKRKKSEDIVRDN
ncbi:MAG TPA: hypothetical protein DEG43_08910 [Acidimicrobiaceae bacterium]|jgi:membrane-bound serine protease (ClpP class)|nr:hypothetical protein [Acidimicrobiaceae bacterium]